MWYISLPQQTEILKLFHMTFTAFGGINTGGIYAWVTQYIRQMYNVFSGWIKSACKKMAKAVRINFFFRHMRSFAHSFKHFPDIWPVDGVSMFRNENSTAFYVLRLYKRFQHIAKNLRQQNLSYFSFAVYKRTAVHNCLTCYIFYFGNSDSGTCHCLKKIIKPVIFGFYWCRKQSFVLFFAKLLPFCHRKFFFEF